MKLLIYRISFLIVQSLIAILGIITFISCFLNFETAEDQTFILVYMMAMIFGLLFVISEIVIIAKSFKRGTLIIDQLAFHSDTKKVRVVSVVLASIGFFLFLGIAILGILLLANVIPTSLTSGYTYTDGLFALFVGLLCLVDCFYLLLYVMLFYRENIFLKIN